MLSVLKSYLLFFYYVSMTRCIPWIFTSTIPIHKRCCDWHSKLTSFPYYEQRFSMGMIWNETMINILTALEEVITRVKHLEPDFTCDLTLMSSIFVVERSVRVTYNSLLTKLHCSFAWITYMYAKYKLLLRQSSNKGVLLQFFNCL